MREHHHQLPFFSKKNKISTIDSNEYRRVEQVAETLRLLENSPYHGFYILDFCKQEIYYVSKNWNSYDFFNQTYENSLYEGSFCKLFLNLNENDKETIHFVCEEAFSFLYSLKRTNILDFIIDFELEFGFGKAKILTKHSLRPIVVSQDGKEGMALVITTMTSKLMTEKVIIEDTRSKAIYVMHDAKNDWNYSIRSINLTQKEKVILILSAQGMSIESIAESMCRSVDTIKTIRRKIFKKFGVRNICEAISYAACNGFLK